MWMKEVEMVDSLDELILAISSWKGFSKLQDGRGEDCLCPEQDHPEFSVQEGGQPRGAASPERGPFLSRKTDRLHVLRLLSSYWCS